MRAFIAVAAVVVAAVSVGGWLTFANSPANHLASVSSGPVVSPAISIWEIHNKAHLEFLPVQDFEDQTMVFTTARR
jgi:hypothetical protein